MGGNSGFEGTDELVEEREQFNVPRHPPKDVGGGAVDEVRVSEASRAMARGRAPDSLGELDAERQLLETELTGLNDKDATTQARLAQLNTQIRGRHLDQGRYRSLCEEQVRLKNRIAQNQSRRRQIKLRQMQLNSLARELNDGAGAPSLGNRMQASMLAELKQLNVNMQTLIQEVRRGRET